MFMKLKVRVELFNILPLIIFQMIIYSLYEVT